VTCNVRCTNRFGKTVSEFDRFNELGSASVAELVMEVEVLVVEWDWFDFKSVYNNIISSSLTSSQVCTSLECAHSFKILLSIFVDNDTRKATDASSDWFVEFRSFRRCGRFGSVFSKRSAKEGTDHEHVRINICHVPTHIIPLFAFPGYLRKFKRAAPFFFL